MYTEQNSPINLVFSCDALWSMPEVVGRKVRKDTTEE